MPAAPTQGGNNNTWGTDFRAWAAVHADLATGGMVIGGSTGNVNVTAPANNHELVYNSSNTWTNILHRYRPQSYGAAMDGTTDDSVAINNMLSDMNSAGRGYAEFPNRDVRCRNIAIPTRALVDLNGATLSLPASASSTDDVVASANFALLTGTSNSTNSSPAAPYGFALSNGTIDTGANGRHALAIFGMNFVLENLILIGGGGGSALWTEYGTQSEDWLTGPNYRKGDTSLMIKNLLIFDYGTPTVFAPSGNNMSIAINAATISGGVTLTCTNTRPHLMTSGQSVTLSAIGGITGAAGTFTATVTGPSTFTVPGTFTGAYTSGGNLSYAVSAAWSHLGPHDSFVDHLVIIAPGARQVGRRGLLAGTGAGGASSAGSQFGNSHIYNNFDVAVDLLSGGHQFDQRSQAEGAFVCCVLSRTNGRNRLPSRIYAGHGGVTLLSTRDSNQCVWVGGMMHQGGQNLSPPTGFTNSATYIENYNCVDQFMQGVMEHDYNQNAAATAGVVPTHSFLQLYMDAYGISSATLTNGWLTSVDATHCGLNMIPSGLTTTTG